MAWVIFDWKLTLLLLPILLCPGVWSGGGGLGCDRARASTAHCTACGINHLCNEPGKPTTRLITTGPFRYSIVLLFQPGLALVLGNIWMVFLLPLSFLLFWYVLIREEEDYLQQKFKENWKGYCKSARRWIWKWKIVFLGLSKIFTQYYKYHCFIDD